MSRVIVIGAGIAGLVCASELKKGGIDQVTVLESLNRVGGRTLSVNGVDLGGAWTWPAHDKNLSKLLDELNLEKMPQNVKGNSMYEVSSGRFIVNARDESPAGPGAFRIKGGAQQICLKLVEMHNLNVTLNTSVNQIMIPKGEKKVLVIDKKGNEYSADAVVLAVPPRAVANLEISPPLSSERWTSFAKTASWMGDAGKVCFFYEEAFWKNSKSARPKNGTFFSQSGPISQGWDNSDCNSNVLCGFVFGKNLQHFQALEGSLEEAKLKSKIVEQLVGCFGPKAKDFIQVKYQDWIFTNKLIKKHEKSKSGEKNVPLKQKHDERIFFAGTESEPEEHGHMEGAVVSGKRVAGELLQFLN